MLIISGCDPSVLLERGNSVSILSHHRRSASIFGLAWPWRMVLPLSGGAPRMAVSMS